MGYKKDRALFSSPVNQPLKSAVDEKISKMQIGCTLWNMKLIFICYLGHIFFGFMKAGLRKKIIKKSYLTCNLSFKKGRVLTFE